jgi:hypothetical protein
VRGQRDRDEPIDVGIREIIVVQETPEIEGADQPIRKKVDICSGMKFALLDAYGEHTPQHPRAEVRHPFERGEDILIPLSEANHRAQGLPTVSAERSGEGTENTTNTPVDRKICSRRDEVQVRSSTQQVKQDIGTIRPVAIDSCSRNASFLPQPSNSQLLCTVGWTTFSFVSPIRDGWCDLGR